MPSSPTPAQLRGARGMLDWSMVQLADAARVSVSTIKRIERDGIQPLSAEIRSTVRNALQRAGVRFLDDEGDGPGVRLGRP